MTIDLAVSFRRNCERRRIARDLHDHIGQSLALLSAALDEASEALPAVMGAERSLINDLRERVAEIGREVHELSHQLHSTILQHLGLDVALNSLSTGLPDNITLP